MKQLTIEQKHGLVKQLIDKSLYEVGLEYGFDKHYKSRSGVVGAVRKILNEVKFNPQKFGHTEEVVGIIEESLEKRRATNNKPVLAEQKTDLEEMDIKEIASTNTKKAAVAVSLKLDALLRSKKEMAKASIQQLSNAFGMLFDKSRVVQGEATEHIAIMSKVNPSELTLEEKLDLLLQKRQKDSDKNNE